jgi:hypothetical protein
LPDAGWQICVIRGKWKYIDQYFFGDIFQYDGWFPPFPEKYIPAPPDEHWGKHLFDLEADENEATNLYSVFPDIVVELQALIKEESKDYKPSQYNIPEVRGFPFLHNGVWAPFLDVHVP